MATIRTGFTSLQKKIEFINNNNKNYNNNDNDNDNNNNVYFDSGTDAITKSKENF